MKAVVLVALAACGTPPPPYGADASACVQYTSPAGFDLTAPAVSFKADVMPVLTTSCSSAICHGVTDSPQGGLFLGAELKQGADAASVYSSLVGPKSGELSTMPYIMPGDPVNSFLMHKLDADQCQFAQACANHTCLDTMPRDGQLPVETRDVVRRWIAQGAKND